MHQSYRDLTDRLGPPQWWDEQAVPRYCAFAPPAVADSYAREVALVEIACQNCGRLFPVACAWSTWTAARGHASLAERIANGALHYGDPPNAGCCAAGPTMTSEARRVLEFWRRGAHAWQREPALEIPLDRPHE